MSHKIFHRTPSLSSVDLAKALGCSRSQNFYLSRQWIINLHFFYHSVTIQIHKNRKCIDVPIDPRLLCPILGTNLFYSPPLLQQNAFFLELNHWSWMIVVFLAVKLIWKFWIAQLKGYSSINCQFLQTICFENHSFFQLTSPSWEVLTDWLYQYLRRLLVNFSQRSNWKRSVSLTHLSETAIIFEFFFFFVWVSLTLPVSKQADLIPFKRANAVLGQIWVWHQ